MTWETVAGITYLRNDSCVCVADVVFKSIRVLQGSCVERHQNTLVAKSQPIKALRRLPNMKIIVSALKVFNLPELVPSGLGKTTGDLLIVTDPVNKTA